jgi:multiple sugar transport system substrate-binding protein
MIMYFYNSKSKIQNREKEEKMAKILKPLSLIFIVIFTMVLITTGCVKKTAGAALRCAFWGDTSEIKIIKDSVERFKKDNPGIEVNLERLPSGDPYTEKILTQIAGGTPPDVMFCNAERFYVYASKGILLPLNEYVKRDKFPIGRFYKRIIDKFSINGELYVLPRDIAPVCVVYYNKDLFDMAGLKYPANDWTWDDLVRVGQALTKKNSDGTMTFGFADDWGIWDTFVLSNGGKYVDDIKRPVRCMLDTKEAIDGLQFRADLIYKYKIMPSPSQLTEMGGVGSSDMFMQGKTALFLSGIWKTPFFREIKKFRWDTVIFPRSTGPKGKNGFLTSGGGYAILKITKYPEAAWKLLTFLAGEEGQRELAQTGLAQPAMMDIANSKDFLDGKPPASKAFLLKAAGMGDFQPDSVKWQEALSAYLYPALDKIWAGKNTAAQVMPGTVKEINKLLAEERKQK